MQQQLYPAELADDSLESLLADRSSRGSPVHLALLLLLAAALGLLPLVRVGVSVQAPGVVRPLTEKHEVRAPVGGYAERLAAREGERVGRGQLLVQLRADGVRSRDALLRDRLARASAGVADLERLTTAPSPAGVRLEQLTQPVHRQSLGQLWSQLDALWPREEEATRILERARALAARELVPRAEVERAELALSAVWAERELRIEEALGRWEAALAQARERLAELEAEAESLALESAAHRIDAPVAGTVEELAPVSPGSYLQPGERIAVISPAGALEAEVYASPRDVGLIRVGTPARLLVDAFDHRDWGFLPGRVTSISDDFLVVDGKPVFRVAVGLARDHLALPSGARGEIRKGMTLRARFMVAERSLWQLLRDDVSDWLSPVEG